jgi:hypothetical protein
MGHGVSPTMDGSATESVHWHRAISSAFLKQRRADYLGELLTIQLSMSEMEAREPKTIWMLTHVDALLLVAAPDLASDGSRQRKRREPHARSGSVGDTGERVPLTKAILKTLRTRRALMSNRRVKHPEHG